MMFAYAFPYGRITRYASYHGRETFTQLIKKADSLGFDAFAAGDHLFMPRYWQHVATEVWFDPFSFLSYAAAISNLKVLTDIAVVPYRSPFQTAKSIATLDFMSGGRVIFGAAVGYLEGEFNILKVPFRERGPITDEYLEIMKVLWTSENPRYEGKYYRFSDIAFWPKPVQKPYPPIWIGGSTKLSIRRAAQHGDGWVPFTLLDVESVHQARQILDGLWVEGGKRKEGFEIVMRAERVNVTTAPLPTADRQAFWGSPDQIADDIESYRRAGATSLIVGFHGMELEEHLASMERFAREVMPRFPRPKR